MSYIEWQCLFITRTGNQAQYNSEYFVNDEAVQGRVLFKDDLDGAAAGAVANKHPHIFFFVDDKTYLIHVLHRTKHIHPNLGTF